jgi:Abortive infection C-terminus
MSEEKLPYRVLTKAAQMFGGPTGFSYAEMSDFFLHALNKHPTDLGPVGGSNRPAGFKWWLSQFQLQQQERLLLQLCRDNYQMWHGQPSKDDREELAAMLADTPIAIVTDPAKIDSQSIGDVWRKALDRRHDDPEGAITAARTLLESVCKHILDECGVEYGDNVDLPKLYGLTSKELSLAPSQHTEDAFKRILGGVESVVNGLANLRNRLGDAHGQGKRPVRPLPRHAELAVNMAGSMASFLLATFEAKR